MSCQFSRQSRRHFLKTTSLAAGAIALGSALPLNASSKDAATEWVTLGKSNVKVTRLAFGTGSMSGQVQRELGQEQFTRLVRYAYDRGIRFYETAESYGDMHRMLGVALQGLPRDSYRVMSKITTHRDLARRQPPLAGRHLRSPTQTRRGGSRRLGAWSSSLAEVSGKRVAAGGDD